MKNFKKLIKESYLGNPLNENKLPDGFHSREDLDQFYNDVAMDEYGKPFAELSIAQKQELISYMNRETEKQFQTDYEKRRRGDYSDDMEGGMTDYQRRRMDENKFNVGDEIVYRGDKPGKVVHVFDKKSFMNPEVEYKIRYQSDGGTTTARVRGKDIALEKDLDDMGRKYFGKDYDLEEDINDPALVRARAAQMKKDQRDREEAEYEAKQAALDKKYGSSFMDKLEAEIGLKQELQDLKDEREQLMMDMEQEAEPEGGEIADRYGSRLNDIDAKMAEIKSELEDLRMYESVNEEKAYDAIVKDAKLEETVTENVSQEVVNKVSRFITSLANYYDYSEQDAVYAIMQALRAHNANFQGLEEDIDLGVDKQAVKDYVQKYKDKMKGSSHSTKKGWVDGIRGLNQETKSEIMKQLKNEGLTRDELIKKLKSVNEAEIPSYLAKNIIFGKAVEDSINFNDFLKRVYHILGPKYYKLTDQGALKDFYDSIRDNKPKYPINLGEDDELNVNVSNDNDIADEQEANSGVVGESKGFNFKQMVKESLIPNNLK